MNVIDLSLTPHLLENSLDLTNRIDALDHLTPVFPPTYFEVPDISFSNSVMTNADLNQSMLSFNELYGMSCDLYMIPNLTANNLIGRLEHRTGSYQKNDNDTDVVLQRTFVDKRNGTTCDSPSSSPVSSSSDDSDNNNAVQFLKGEFASGSSYHSWRDHSTGSLSAQSAETSSGEGSSSGASKKMKPNKRKKRKDPNEPQKPVSAYALFFRDSQAAIKGHNPSASFGEVSKIVASLWDQLDPEHKDLYKKRTEMAKKQYLKQLAAYKANQVSQSSSEEIKKMPSSLCVGSMSTEAMPGFQALRQQSSSEAHGVLRMPGQSMNQLRQIRSPIHMTQISAQFLQHHHQVHNQQQMIQQLTLATSLPSSPPHQQQCPPHQQQGHPHQEQCSPHQQQCPPHQHLSPLSNSMYNNPHETHGRSISYQHTNMALDHQGSGRKYFHKLV